MFKTFIVWGEESTIRENDKESICGYSFETQAELDAFLLGVDAGCGWMECEVFMSREEAERRVAEAGDEPTEVERLVILADELGLEASDLDDAIHDLAQEIGLDDLNSLEDGDDQEAHIAAVERAASNINNGDIENQIEYLLDNDTPESVEELLRRLASEIDWEDER